MGYRLVDSKEEAPAIIQQEEETEQPLRSSYF